MVLDSGRTVIVRASASAGRTRPSVWNFSGIPQDFQRIYPRFHPSGFISKQSGAHPVTGRNSHGRTPPRAPANAGVPALARPRPAAPEKTPSLARRSWSVGFAAMECTLLVCHGRKSHGAQDSENLATVSLQSRFALTIKDGGRF